MIPIAAIPIHKSLPQRVFDSSLRAVLAVAPGYHPPIMLVRVPTLADLPDLPEPGLRRVLIILDWPQKRPIPLKGENLT